MGEGWAEPLLQIFDADNLVAELAPRALADDAPEYDISELAASYRGSDEGAVGAVGSGDPAWSTQGPTSTTAPSAEPQRTTGKIGLELLDLLASPAVASRRAIYRTYDQMVGTDTVVGPGADAAGMRHQRRADRVPLPIDAPPPPPAVDPILRAPAPGAEAARHPPCMGAT